jgi:hypothetical protein
MIGRLFGALLPNKNTRELRRMGRLVKRINELEEQTAALDDAALKDLTASFRARLDDGERLDALLPEAFAAVREAARRTLGMRHFDVQLLGGITLHEGQHRGDAHRRGQDPRGDAARLSERPHSPGRARRDRERLSRPPRRHLDGAGLRGARHERSGSSSRVRTAP